MQQSSGNQEIRPPVPPFNEETARQKVKAAQDAWNTRDPERVTLAYTEDSRWRNRDEFFEGREEIVAFLKRKWARELDYRLEDRKSTRLNSSHANISYAVFCLKKNKINNFTSRH